MLLLLLPVRTAGPYTQCRRCVSRQRQSRSYRFLDSALKLSPNVVSSQQQPTGDEGEDDDSDEEGEQVER